MSNPADKRILGLSPRARRVVVPFLAIAAVLVAIAYYSSNTSGEPSGAGPVLDGDLHAVGDLESPIFVGGHGDAGYRASTGGWTQIDSLDDKDVIGSASTAPMVVAGGHAGGPRR